MSQRQINLRSIRNAFLGHGDRPRGSSRGSGHGCVSVDVRDIRGVGGELSSPQKFTKSTLSFGAVHPSPHSLVNMNIFTHMSDNCARGRLWSRNTRAGRP
jgi:hypothetical protein